MADAPRVRVSRQPTSKGPRPGRRAAAALAASALPLALAGCISREPPPPPDTDATPETAQALPLTGPRPDSLRCDDAAGPDCVDWFRFRPTAPGMLRVAIAPQVPAGEAAPSTPPPFELVVVEEAGAEIGRSVAGPETPVALVGFEVKEPKTYLASVRLPPKSGTQAYQLAFEAQLRTAPPPATKTRRWTVLEVDPNAAGGPSVLIDGGRADALRAGQRGRLVEGERTLGRIVVVDVFEEGARARIEGRLSGTITADTVAEIEVPADSR
jgi:hypothetical protein